jgi:Domain of unknown function (DUF4340)
MKPRTLLILLVVVLGLGAFIWFYERELPSSEERTAQAKKVLELEKEDVNAVTIESKVGTVHLERIPAAKKDDKDKKDGKDEDGDEAAEPAEWRMTRPLAARADAFAVDRLLDAVAGLEKTRTLEDANPKDVGLDKPRATLRLATKEGEKVLAFGAEVPPGGSLVAGFKGAKDAYVVGDTILTDLEKDPGDWRDKLMFRGDREAVRRITLTGAAAGPVVLVKRPAGFWMEKPIADRADRDLVDGLLSDLTGLTAERFVAGSRPLAELGLAPPRDAVEVAFQGVTPPVLVELGGTVTAEAAPEGQTSGELTYARVGNTVFEVRTRLAESVRRAPADWRALQLSAFAVHDVESASVQEGQNAMQLTRSGTDWKRGTTLISYLPVSDLLFAVTGARASRLLTPQEVQAMQAALAKPSLTFAFHTKDAGDETLLLYPAVKEGIPARASGRDSVLLLPAETLREIQEKLRDVRAAKAVKPEK